MTNSFALMAASQNCQSMRVDMSNRAPKAHENEACKLLACVLRIPAVAGSNRMKRKILSFFFDCVAANTESHSNKLS